MLCLFLSCVDFFNPKVAKIYFSAPELQFGKKYSDFFQLGGTGGLYQATFLTQKTPLGWEVGGLCPGLDPSGGGWTDGPGPETHTTGYAFR